MTVDKAMAKQLCGERMKGKAEGGILVMSDTEWPTCELPAGHRGFHRWGTLSWLDVEYSPDPDDPGAA